MNAISIERTEHAVTDTRRGGASGTRVGPATALSRARAVNRMNFRQWMLLALPWAIVAVTLAAHGAILAIIRAQGVALPGDSGNGVVTTIFIFAIPMYAAIATKHFPFTLGLGVTRRDFYAGTTLTALINGTVNAVIVLIVAEIERATDGWAVHLEGFSVIYRVTDSRATVFFAVLLTTMACAAIGTFGGVLFLRWKVTGIFSAVAVLVLVLAVAAVVITWLRGWPAVGRFFVDTPFAALALGIPAVIALAGFGFGYRMMRTVEA